jgi:hypothetical protein
LVSTQPGGPMDDDARSEAMTKITELLARSRELLRSGDIKGAERKAREAIQLQRELAEPKNERA